MKKVNNLLLKTFAVFTVFFMVSCSSDDDTTTTDDNNIVVDDPEEEIPVDPFIGEWKFIGWIENGTYEPNDDECEYAQILVEEDNNGILTVHDCDFGDESVDFTWEKLEENKYKLTIPDDTVTLNTAFEDNKMTITNSDEPGYAEVYQKQ